MLTTSQILRLSGFYIFVLLKLFSVAVSHHINSRDDAVSDQVSAKNNSDFVTQIVKGQSNVNATDSGTLEKKFTSPTSKKPYITEERKQFQPFLGILSESGNYYESDEIVFETSDSKIHITDIRDEEPGYDSNIKEASLYTMEEVINSSRGTLDSSEEGIFDNLTARLAASQLNISNVNNEIDPPYDNTQESLSKIVQSNCSIKKSSKIFRHEITREVVCNFNLRFTLSLDNGMVFRSRVLRCLDQFMKRMEPFRLIGMTFKVDDIASRKIIWKENKFFLDHYKLVYLALMLSILLLFSSVITGFRCSKKTECETPDSVSTDCTIVSIPSLADLSKDCVTNHRSLDYLVNDSTATTQRKKCTVARMTCGLIDSVTLGLSSPRLRQIFAITTSRGKREDK